MIPDKLFKSLQHSFQDFKMLYNGQELEPGYKPDYVLKRNNEYIILESENTSSRKTYVGGMMKAAHFLQNEKKGKLVFIVVPKENTKALSIAKHLTPYLNWVNGKTNLKEVYVIEAKQYYNNDQLLALDCDDFYSCALKV
ncbi:hypothetical protein ACFS6H_03385 [Terrimonas rubra]|uniref:Uncharacterized protein n=1 Tax=Terrimonas rubra TaxID=1035890 RepID=A0ABW6A393_9BACT